MSRSIIPQEDTILLFYLCVSFLSFEIFSFKYFSWHPNNVGQSTEKVGSVGKLLCRRIMKKEPSVHLMLLLVFLPQIKSKSLSRITSLIVAALLNVC